MEHNPSMAAARAAARSLIAVITTGLLLAGCAGSPAPKTPQTDSAQPVTQQERKAVKAEPLSEAHQAVMNRARSAIEQQRWDTAAPLLETLSQQRPNVAAVHASLAWVARKQGNQEQAIAAYRTAFDLDPEDAVSANNLALLLREKGRFREAASLLQEGIQYSPDTADLHYNLAVIAELYLLDLELAVKHYRRFTALTSQRNQENQEVMGWIADLERRLD